MNILYGVCGEGYGHSSRALVIGKYLENKGHKLIILAHGKSYEVLKDKFKLKEIHGMHLIFKEGILKKRKTVYHNLKIFPRNILKARIFHELIKEFKPDLCICDMEPVVSILANFYKIPLITVDNQHLLTDFKVDIPEKYKKDFYIAKLIIDAYSIGSRYSIVTGFGNEKPLKKNTFLVYPIVRGDVKNLKPVYGNKILVYLNKPDEIIVNILKKIDENFVIFGFNVNKKEENLEFKTKEYFLQELKKCKTIIATAGFSLISESIYLKKPYFALPLKGQFEQVFNSLFLKDSGFGDYTDNLNEKKVLNFLNNLEKYKRNLKKYKPDYDKLFEVIDEVLKKVEKPMI
jgi:uncharacterized protein (TIGR00661 family)